MTAKRPRKSDQAATIPIEIVRRDRSGMTLEQLEALMIPWQGNTDSVWVGLGENADQPEQSENDPTPT